MTHRPDDLGVAVIGTGKMGADHVRRIEETVSGARVTAVVDVDRGRAEAVASRLSTEQPRCLHSKPLTCRSGRSS
ncbi:Gfo/Idh/MocA family oxidoreductase, partial [Streptomyces nigra]